MKKKTKNNKDGWQEFSKSNRKDKFSYPSITVAKDNNLVFNKLFVGEYLKKAPYIRVSFNEKRRQIGIKIADGSHPNAYRVSIIGRTGIGILRLNRFFKHFDINVEEKFHIKAIKDSKLMFIINLKKEEK